MPNMFPMMGVLTFIVWLFLVIAIIIGYIFIVVAAWRIMKSHESISETLKELKESLKSSSP